MAKKVANFVFENIYFWFGTPLEIISKRGPDFRGYLVCKLMEILGIVRNHFTTYYLQCNGLIEMVIRMIVKMITKQVQNKKKDWDQHHLQASLWVYRTSFKTSLGYTLFHLVLGKEDLLPIEFSNLRVLASGESSQIE